MGQFEVRSERSYLDVRITSGVTGTTLAPIERGIMNIASGTHFQRVLLAIFLGGFALFCDHAAPEANRAIIQEFLLTVTVFAWLFVELRRTLLRRRQALLAVMFLVAHCYGLYLKRSVFPFESSLSVIIIAVVEAIALGLVYIRLGQSIDPQGPFGLSDAEKKLRQRIPPLQ